MTLWNPTVQPVNSFVRVPVTSDYTITDPLGHIILSDVSLNHFNKQMKIVKLFLVSSYSNDYYKHSWTNKYSSKRAIVQCNIASTWLQYILFSNQE